MKPSEYIQARSSALRDAADRWRRSKIRDRAYGDVPLFLEQMADEEDALLKAERNHE